MHSGFYLPNRNIYLESTPAGRACSKSTGEVYLCVGKQQRLLRLPGLQEGLNLNPTEENHLL